MKKRMLLLLLIVALIIPVSSVGAQKGLSNIFTFEDGTTIQYPDGWNAFIRSNGFIYVQSEHTQILLDVNPATMFSDHGITEGDIVGLLVDSYNPIDASEGEITAAQVETLQLGSHSAARFVGNGQDQYGSFEHWGLITQLNNGMVIYISVVNLDGDAITEGQAALDILSTLNESASTYTPDTLDLSNPTLDQSYTFSDGTTISFPADWTAENAEDQGYEVGVANDQTYIVFDIYTDIAAGSDLATLFGELFVPIGTTHTFDATKVYAYTLGDYPAMRYDYTDVDTAGAAFDRIVLLTQMENGTLFYIAITPRSGQPIIQRKIALQIAASLTPGEPPTSTTPTTDPTATPGSSPLSGLRIGPTATPTSTEPTVDTSILFQDDFTTPDAGWEIGNYEGGRVGPENGAYVVTSIVETSFMWGIANQDFSDLQLDVDATQISGPTNNNNGYGVMCRIQKNGDGYVLVISGDGFASIQIVQDGTSTTIVEWAEAAEVIQGNSTNHLQAICSGSDLQLYANGTLVASTQDSTFTSGDIAFIVMSFEAEPSEVHFDNLVVTAPGAATSTPTTTTPNPTATPSTTTTNPTSQPSISSLLHATALLQDDFSDPASGWEIGDYSGGSVGYGNGDYVITSTVDDSFMWGIANQDFTDISLEVDTNQVVGPTNNNNGYGVICRLQSSGDGYALRISGDGWAGIHLIQNGATSPLVDWAETPAVNQGNTTNHLRAVCSGSTLQLYVNDTLVAEVQDTTYASGDIAFMVASFEAEPSEIHFDNLVVNEP